MDTRIGAYRLLRELGTGGMGTVYLAEVEGRVHQLEPGAHVALKVVHAHLEERPDFFKRFLREAELGWKVEHDNVVRCLDCDFLPMGDRRRHVLVMEYVEGQTLRALLDELDKVPEELARHLGREIAEGLIAIHAAGVIHRDLKPENVLITPTHQVKIMDLGVARLQDEAIRLSQTGHFAGSLLYAAPESFRTGGSETDTRADLYGLGVLLYEVATGIHPFQHDDVQTVLYRILEEEPRRVGDLNPQITPFFEEVVHSLMAKDPADRIASAQALREVLVDGEASPWWEERAAALQRETKLPLRRVRIPRETALFGRQAEVDALVERFQEVKAGDGRVVLIEGEAGIGKTRLVDELAAQLQHDGEDLNFLFGSYPPGGAATGTGAFTTAYREHLGTAGLEQSLCDVLPATSTLAPAFAALLRGEPPPPGTEPLTKESLHTVFVHATQALAADRPTVVLIDDLHFAPEEGLAIFTSLALAVPGHRVLLIGALRPGPPRKWLTELERRAHASRLTLPRLGPKDLERILLDALKSERLAAELGWRIATKSDGNPYFVFEILRGLREEDLLRLGPDGTWMSTSSIDDLRVPSSIVDLVNARVADLSREERELLEIAACCGFSFDPNLVARATEQELLPTLKLLGQVERRHRLVRAVGQRFVFDHHQVQEALYGALSDPLRREYHGALGRALEELVDARARGAESVGGAICTELCEHLLAAELGEVALPYLDATLAHLESNHLRDQAARIAGLALDLPDLLAGERRIEVLLRSARELNLLGRPEEERVRLDQALELAVEQGEPGPEGRVRTEIGWHLIRVSRCAEAISELQRAQELALEAGDEKTVSMVRGNLGIAYLEDSQFEAARPHLDARLSWLEEHGPLEEVPPASANIGLWLLKQGRRPESLERLEQVLELTREVGNRRCEMGTLGNLAILYRQSGRLEDAQRCAVEGLEVARENGDRRGEANATMALGAILHGHGGDDEARAHYEHARVMYTEVGDRRGEAYALGNLGILTAHMGRIAESVDWYERCLAASLAIEDRWGAMNSKGDSAYLLLRLGCFAEARSHVEEALALAREIGYVEGQAEWHLALAEIAEASGDLAEAGQQVEQAIDLAPEGGFGETRAEAALVLGRIAVGEGRREEAVQQFAQADEVGEAHDVPQVFLRARAHRLLLSGDVDKDAAEALAGRAAEISWTARIELAWVLWRATDDPRRLQEARRLLAHLRDHAPAKHRDTMVERIPMYASILG